MAPITLWHFVASPPSWAVRMTASILKLPLELNEIDVVNRQQKSAEFRKINPAGTVPVIKDGDLYLSESHAIMKYLLDKYGKEEHKKLYPNDLTKRAAVDHINFFDAGVAFIRLREIAIPAMIGLTTEVTPRAAQNVEDVYATLEMFINKKDFVATNEFTIADLSVGSTILGLNHLHALDKAKYPITAAWLQRLQDKPEIQEIAVPGSQVFSKGIKGCWKRNQAKKTNTVIMPPITIYHFITSTPSWSVRMMASLLKLPVELKETKIYKLEQKTTEFRQINPVGAIPAIKDGNFYLGESHAIIKYLLGKYGNEEHKKLYPTDVVKRAKIDQINFFNAGVAFVLLRNMTLTVIFNGKTEFSQRYIKNAEDVFETLEMFINKQDYVANNEFSLADLSIGTTMIGYDSLLKIDKVNVSPRIRKKVIMAPITIYHWITSPPSWNARMMASYLGLPVELKETKIYELEQKTPEFKKMNPVGAVPAIKDGDFYLGESHAIMLYLLGKYGSEEQKEKLYPTDVVKRARVDQINFFNAGVAFIHLRNSALPIIFEGQTEISPRSLKYIEEFVYDALERFLTNQDYVANNEFSIADIALGNTMIAYDVLNLVDKSKYPFINAWLERLRAMPIFQEVAVPMSKVLVELLHGYIQRNIEKNSKL
ncbi:hypothetical protein NE865_04516 [Phthorimaea operculella]|nr:hypothetical protein NE865_04516 [Phthorimaea operculella]